MTKGLRAFGHFALFYYKNVLICKQCFIKNEICLLVRDIYGK